MLTERKLQKFQEELNGARFVVLSSFHVSAGARKKDGWLE